MFIKLFLTIEQLTALHAVVDGNVLDAEIAKLLCVKPDASAVQSLKKRMVVIKSSDFKTDHQTYSVDLLIEEILDVSDGRAHVYTPMSVITHVMTDIARFPEFSQAMYGKSKTSLTNSPAQLEAGSAVRTWCGSEGLWNWGGTNPYNVARVDGEKVYLVETENETKPDTLLKEEHLHRICRELALAELERRGVDYFDRNEFILHT